MHIGAQCARALAHTRNEIHSTQGPVRAAAVLDQGVTAGGRWRQTPVAREKGRGREDGSVQMPA